MGGKSQQNLVICDSKHPALDYIFIASCDVQNVLSIRCVRDLLRYVIALKKIFLEYGMAIGVISIQVQHQVI
jgi:hypothetical protein